jgi:hypothetical protein
MTSEEFREIPYDDACLVGMRVVPGRDWVWGTQGGPDARGTILSTCGDKWVNVRWDNDDSNRYRHGSTQLSAGGEWDLMPEVVLDFEVI